MDGNAAGRAAATCRAWPDTARESHRALYRGNRCSHWDSLADPVCVFGRNWKKTSARSEVDFLMPAVPLSQGEVPTLNKNNIRLEYIGRQQSCRLRCREKMAWRGNATAGNTGMVLTLALNTAHAPNWWDASGPSWTRRPQRRSGPY